VTTLGDPLPPPAAPTAGSARGRLFLSDRAARHLIEGAAAQTSLPVTDVDVDVDDVDDDGITARITLVARYPNGALSNALRDFRRTVADDVSRLAGRPLRRLDIVVEDLVVGPGPRQRVE
jgi:hypothetical protein